jgi:hypothetical protein
MSTTESDIHGVQNTACKIMKKLSKKEKEDFQQNISSKERWITYFKNLWIDPNEADMIEFFNDIYDFNNIQLQEIEL